MKTEGIRTGHRAPRMTPAEAARWLESRAQRRCDGHTITWSLTDVTALRTLLEPVTALRTLLEAGAIGAGDDQQRGDT